MPVDDLQNANNETRDAWDANAQVWDARMGDEGNDFFRILQWPVITGFLEVAGWDKTITPPRILDIACGNGLTSRKLAKLGAEVVASDFSANLIELARQRPNLGGRITYHLVDATDESALLALGEHNFDAALCNMALFDMVDIEPLFHVLPKMLKPGGCFVFSLMHPAFNNSSSVHVAEEMDDEGSIKTIYSVKTSRYMTPYQAHGVALRNQPKAQIYFERPIQFYLNLGFKNGFVLDGFAECAFPSENHPSYPLSWGGQFSEIPPVLVVRMRLK
jgi:2-polyprenyl-3-methyl-5-hydroxy-6-metoxy-1,4-benzoquinol methylase